MKKFSLLLGMFVFIMAGSSAHAEQAVDGEMSFDSSIKLPGAAFADTDALHGFIYVQDGKIVPQGKVKTKAVYCSAAVRLDDFKDDPSVRQLVNDDKVVATDSYLVSKRQRIAEQPKNDNGRCEGIAGNKHGSCAIVLLAIGPGSDLLKDNPAKTLTGYIKKVTCYNAQAAQFGAAFSRSFGTLATYEPKHAAAADCDPKPGNPPPNGLNEIAPPNKALRSE